MQPRMRNYETTRRPGAVLAVVQVTLFAVALVGAALVRAVVLHDQQARRREDQQQAFWLAESGLQRGVHAAAKSPDYKGETWPVPAETLGGGRAGRVVIQVEPNRAPQPGRVLRVEAYYPDEEFQRTLCQRETLIK